VYAAGHVGRDQRTDVLVLDDPLALIEARGSRAKTERKILQLAFAALVADRAVERVIDQQEFHRRLLRGDRARVQEPIDLPKSDVLIYLLEDDSRVIVRPSGTEPKLKCYYEVRETVAAGETMEAAEARARQVLDELMREHGATLTG
jgi:phosphomannomutase